MRGRFPATAQFLVAMTSGCTDDGPSGAEATTEDLLREVRARGFGSLTEYVMRDGLVVDGETWTFDRYVAAGAEQAEQAAAYCATSP